MKLTFSAMCEALTQKIQNSYSEGITMEEAEKLAGEFLHAQLTVAGELTKADLDARMKKAGTKAIKAKAYTDCVGAAEKKPSDVLIENVVVQDSMVIENQSMQDKAEAHRDSLERYYQIFREAHTHFRMIARGSFNG